MLAPFFLPASAFQASRPLVFHPRFPSIRALRTSGLVRRRRSAHWFGFYAWTTLGQDGLEERQVLRVVLGQVVAQFRCYTWAVLSPADRAADLPGKSSPQGHGRVLLAALTGRRTKSTLKEVQRVLVRQSEWKGPGE